MSKLRNLNRQHTEAIYLSAYADKIAKNIWKRKFCKIMADGTTDLLKEKINTYRKLCLTSHSAAVVMYKCTPGQCDITVRYGYKYNRGHL